MSKFSGKSDFYDSIIEVRCEGDSFKLEKCLSNTDVYISTSDGRDHKLEIKNEYDAIKYYPYLVSVSAHSKDTQRGYVLLSSKSYIDIEESNFLSWRIETALKYWRRCKRSKIPFDKEECMLKIDWRSNPSSYGTEIANRVAEYGDKADFSDIHTPMHEYMRRKWADAMIDVGYTKDQAFRWCFNEYWGKNIGRYENAKI